MKFQTIVSANNLAENLHSPNWLILDCRGGLLHDNGSYTKYLKGHIPNSFYYCCIECNFPSLCNKTIAAFDPSKDATHIVESLKENGFNENSQIVIYDEHSSSFADSMWLLLRAIGCQYVAVLQGGLKDWQENNLPLTICESMKESRNV